MDAPAPIRGIVFVNFWLLSALVAHAQVPPRSPVPVSFTNTMVLTVEGSNVWIFPVDQPAPARHRAVPYEVLRVRDRGQTGLRSRTSLRMFDRSVARIDELTDFEIPAPPDTSGPSILKLLKGALYLFHRGEPSDMEIQSRLATAATRGTEFHVAVDEASGQMTLTLLEGEAELRNAAGRLPLKSGEQGVASPGLAPFKTPVIDTMNLIQWCLYYPAVLDLSELPLTAAEAAALAESMAAYRSGDLRSALMSYPEGRAPGSPAETVYLGALLLSVGRVDQTQQLLASLPAQAPSQVHRLATALRQLIAAVQFRPPPNDGLEGGAGPRSVAESSTPIELATEWLARSYLDQAQGRLADARNAARHATERSAAFGFAWERLAEMEFSFGQTRAAMTALEQALAHSPRHAQAWALEGFALSARNDYTAALQSFDRALEADGALGNAWLGRGLCRIRQGDAAGGREDLQVAAALEPQRALLRSYLGKAFGNEGDASRARTELNMAQELDPNDPTAWLYSALLHQQQHQINQAVRDLEQSQALNDNRRLYRSGLLLDQDRAVRGANLASIYREAGMTDVSVREAGRAVSADYANYSAHLFLANSYNDLRDRRQIDLRYETPWLNEFLVANLLAPTSAGTLAQSISQQEYSRLFEQDRGGWISQTEYASDGEWLHQDVFHGSSGNSSFAAGALYHTANGDHPNGDIEQGVLTLRWKQQLTPADSLFFQAQGYDAQSEDVRPRYNVNQFNPSLSVREQHEPTVLAGLHHEWAPGQHTLFLSGFLNQSLDVDNPQQQTLLFSRIGGGPILSAETIQVAQDYDSRLEIATTEAQHIWQTDRQTLIGGVRFQRGDIHTENRQTGLPFPLSPLGPQDVEADFERLSLYAYEHWQVLPSLQLVGGLTYDRLVYPDNFRFAPISTGEGNTDQLSPKAGWVWTPSSASTVRGAYARSLSGVSIDQSYQLEPSQVAGFNQLYRSLIPESVEGANAAAQFDTWSLSFEQRLGTGTYLALQGEWLESSVDRTVGVFEFDLPLAPGPSSFQRDTSQSLYYRERSLTFAAHQLLGQGFALGSAYRLSLAELDSTFTAIPSAAVLGPNFDPDNEVHALLHHLDIFAAYNHPSGLFSRVDALWWGQSNRDYQPDIPGDDFWQFNLHTGYRFWRRKAELRVSLLNLTDRSYRLNPLNLTLDPPRERQLALSFKLDL